jgi:hypothetical protein
MCEVFFLVRVQVSDLGCLALFSNILLEVMEFVVTQLLGELLQ